MSRRTIALLCLSGVLACTEDPPVSAHDAGEGDGATPVDAGEGDSGTPLDAGEGDGGTPLDAGEGDGGTPLDAGDEPAVDAGRPRAAFAPVSCNGWKSCWLSSKPGDVCAALLDLRPGETFAVTFDNIGASWGEGNVFHVTFRRGVEASESRSVGGRKRNTTTVLYDGECGLNGVSAYSGDPSESKTAAMAITAVDYVTQ